MDTIESLHTNKIGKVSDKWSSYLPYYDRLFKEYKNSPIRLLEIGVQNGGSLETWSKYFNNACSLIGCDIDSKCSVLKYNDSRIHVVVGDANDINTRQTILNLSNNFDIIIDDGSHISNDIINTFLLYFEHLVPDGLFVIEDTHTLYYDSHGGGVLNDLSAYNFFKKLIDVINYQFWGRELSIDTYFRTYFPLGRLPRFIKEGWIESIEFRNSLIVIKKSSSPVVNKLGKRIITGQEALVNDGVLRFIQS